jgi:hypothetical protein
MKNFEKVWEMQQTFPWLHKGRKVILNGRKYKIIGIDPNNNLVRILHPEGQILAVLPEKLTPLTEKKKVSTISKRPAEESTQLITQTKQAITDLHVSECAEQE